MKHFPRTEPLKRKISREAREITRKAVSGIFPEAKFEKYAMEHVVNMLVVDICNEYERRVPVILFFGMTFGVLLVFILENLIKIFNR